MSWRRFRSAAVVAALLLVSATTAAAQAIKIAWDPSTDPRVVGYVVYVGTASGAPTSSVDVGNGNSFVFAPPQAGVTFYFSVASYDANHAVGGRSQQVSATADDGRPWALISSSSPRSSSPARINASSPDRIDAVPSKVCVDDGHCYTSAAILTGAGTITALAASDDEHIFYVEDGRFIRAVPAGGGATTTLLDADGAGTYVVSLALDPSFATTGRAFTGELAPSRNGAELLIARYRNVHDAFGERAVIAAGLPANAPAVPLSVDTEGHIFLALPTPPDGALRSPYDGMVLRMNGDGTVPHDNPIASPVFTQGYDVPTALVDDRPNATLLVAGYNDAGGTQVRRAPSGETASGSSASVALLGRNGEVLLATPQADGSYHTAMLDLSAVGMPSAVVSRDGNLFVALRTADDETSVLRLSPVSSSSTK